ncbi:DinB superfamily protein [Zunongwangia mangrovi]|uniref:DinB superfamily protein n=1 Tax=Zunongwangia mangrovi TaxID=1334022 RepID=A0A1I1G5B3_9FLAO|nr:DinB family protein [Zunongwangia mangrovi]SFC06794.1 DinB superfamily protein [Zunongwangia mangrovi]
MTVEQLNASEYNPFYENYIKSVPKESSLGTLFLENLKEVSEILERLEEAKLGYKYAEDKWTIAEVFQHLIDVERIFQFRALSLARRESQALQGFDHDAYVTFSRAENRSLKSLKNEFEIVRKSTLFLFDSFTEDMLKQVGQMNGSSATPRAIGFIIIGHTKHHLKILQERYSI